MTCRSGTLNSPVPAGQGRLLGARTIFKGPDVDRLSVIAPIGTSVIQLRMYGNYSTGGANGNWDPSADWTSEDTTFMEVVVDMTSLDISKWYSSGLYLHTGGNGVMQTLNYVWNDVKLGQRISDSDRDGDVTAGDWVTPLKRVHPSFHYDPVTREFRIESLHGGTENASFLVQFMGS